MKIGFFSDLHCGREEITNNNRYPSRSLGKLQKLLLDFANIGVDLAICLGDVINGSTSKADDIEHLSRVAKVIRDSSVPVLVMQGNHDFKNLDDDTFYRISDFVRPPFVCRADDVNLIFGVAFDENMNDEMAITVIATGFDDNGVKKSSGTIAKDRLKILLISDRVNCSPEMMEKMLKEVAARIRETRLVCEVSEEEMAERKSL